MNIQRGRDHGLPDYNSVRQQLGLEAIESFADISSDDDNPEDVEAVVDAEDVGRGTHREAQQQRGLTYLFITHDLSVVQHISTRVAVMYLGTLCELAPAQNIFASPRHPYTQALLSAIPKLGVKGQGHIRLKGEVPTPIELPSGCVFHGRCAHANKRCIKEIPQALEVDTLTRVACHGVEEGRV